MNVTRTMFPKRGMARNVTMFYVFYGLKTANRRG